jgi:hypothetical protein
MWGVRPPSIDAAWGLVQSPSCLGPVPRVSCQSGHIAPTQSTETQSQTRNAKGASQGFLPCLLLGRDEARGTRPLKPCSICEHSVAWPSAAGPCWRCFKSSVGTAISVVFIRTRCPSSGGRRGHRKSCQGWPTNEHTKPRPAFGLLTTSRARTVEVQTIEGLVVVGRGQPGPACYTGLGLPEAAC